MAEEFEQINESIESGPQGEVMRNAEPMAPGVLNPGGTLGGTDADIKKGPDHNPGMQLFPLIFLVFIVLFLGRN